MSPARLGAPSRCGPLGTCRLSPPKGALRASGGAGPPRAGSPRAGWFPWLRRARPSPAQGWCPRAECGTFRPGLSRRIRAAGAVLGGGRSQAGPRALGAGSPEPTPPRCGLWLSSSAAAPAGGAGAWLRAAPMPLLPILPPRPPHHCSSLWGRRLGSCLLPKPRPTAVRRGRGLAGREGPCWLGSCILSTLPLTATGCCTPPGQAPSPHLPVGSR